MGIKFSSTVKEVNAAFSKRLLYAQEYLIQVMDFVELEMPYCVNNCTDLYDYLLNKIKIFKMITIKDNYLNLDAKAFFLEKNKVLVFADVKAARITSPERVKAVAFTERSKKEMLRLMVRRLFFRRMDSVHHSFKWNYLYSFIDTTNIPFSSKKEHHYDILFLNYEILKEKSMSNINLGEPDSGPSTYFKMLDSIKDKDVNNFKKLALIYDIYTPEIYKKSDLARAVLIALEEKKLNILLIIKKRYPSLIITENDILSYSKRALIKCIVSNRYDLLKIARKEFGLTLLNQIHKQHLLTAAIEFNSSKKVFDELKLLGIAVRDVVDYEGRAIKAAVCSKNLKALKILRNVWNNIVDEITPFAYTEILKELFIKHPESSEIINEFKEGWGGIELCLSCPKAKDFIRSVAKEGGPNSMFAALTLALPGKLTLKSSVYDNYLMLERLWNLVPFELKGELVMLSGLGSSVDDDQDLYFS